LSKRRVTVSTCGVADKIPSLAEDLGVKLAISLHAPNNEIRNKIMPINKKYPLEVLIKACHEFQAKQQHRQYITMEYVLLKGVNDSVENAKELIQLVKGLEVKFNLIPFNPWDGCAFEPTSNNQMHRFAKVLEDAYLAAPIRVSRGQDIMAACGQLKSAFQQKNALKSE
jgi:23S rRNA (adenine2503-C2)-methyltransferase